MKRVTTLILSALMLINLVGCGNSEKQDAFLKYVNEDMTPLAELQDQMFESFNDILARNYDNDMDLYTALTEETVPLAQDLNNEALALATNINDEALLEVHKLFIDCASKYESAFSAMAIACLSQDTTLLLDAKEKITEAELLEVDYMAKLNALGDEYGLVRESED
jgi:hypothetical protein